MKKLHKIETPKHEHIDDVLSPEVMNPKVLEAIKKSNEDYLHWEQLKYKEWIPKDIFPKKELFWSLLQILRHINSIKTPVRDEKGNHFAMNVKQYAEFLHEVDMEMGGHLMGISNFSKGDERQFIDHNIIEESISSSQLEGASTSRAVAKKMLLEGRKPQNHSELMIINNYNSMRAIENKFSHEDLSLDMIRELHRLITTETIKPEKQGVFRETLDENGDELIIAFKDKITYYAPSKEFVTKEIERLISFANDKENKNYGFIHPLIKAIILHFWIGFLHPFEDGNGRLARILFYWYMLRHKYWAFSYISLSGKILKSPDEYAWAYVYSEQDNNDLTYFINYNIKKLKLARKEFQEYVGKKMNENRTYSEFIRKNHDFNERQIKLLHFLHNKPKEHTILTAHQNLYNISKPTAVSDLKKLVTMGLLNKKKIGRNIFYYPTEKAAFYI